MKRITIKKRIYKPHWWQWLMFWTLYRKFEINIPESWQEVEPSNLLMLFAASLKKDDGERIIECIKAILPSNIQDEVHLIDTNSIIRISQFMGFLEPRITDEDDAWIYEPSKMLNELPTYEFAITRTNLVVQTTDVYTIPGKDLENITCMAFRDALSAYKMVQAGNRKAGWLVVKELLSPSIHTQQLQVHSQYPQAELIIRYFTDCLEVLYHTVNQLSPTFFENGNGDGNDGGIDFGWDGIFMEIAKDGVFGTYQEVLKSRFHDVYLYCIKKYEDDLRIQEQLKSNGNET